MQEVDPRKTFTIRFPQDKTAEVVRFFEQDGRCPNQIITEAVLQRMQQGAKKETPVGSSN